jgi:hypothetical protein
MQLNLGCVVISLLSSKAAVILTLFAFSGIAIIHISEIKIQKVNSRIGFYVN